MLQRPSHYITLRYKDIISRIHLLPKSYPGRHNVPYLRFFIFNTSIMATMSFYFGSLVRIVKDDTNAEEYAIGV